jgi:arabinofuranosyltransferase
MDITVKRGALILCVVAIVAIVTAIASDALRSPATGIDDANIFLVYARSVSAGEGFVFNPDGERVEGFTSLLWVLIGSAAIASAGNPELPLLAFNVVLVSLTIVACIRSFVFRRPDDGKVTGLIWASGFVLLILLDFRYVVWNTVTLMETALWGTLLTLATIVVLEGRAHHNHARGLAVLVVLLMMTRPEALLWAPAVGGLFYLKQAALETRARAFASVLPSLLAYGLTAVILTVFRLAYFGAPLPNTYYAKVSPSFAMSVSEGGRYLAAYVVSGPIPFACTVALVGSLVHLIRVRFRDHPTLILTMLSVIGLTVPVLTGGDHFDGFRFYQSVYPILLLALFNFVRLVIPQYLRAPRASPSARIVKLATGASIVAVVGAVQIVQAMQFGSRPLQREFDIAAAGRQTGLRLNVLFGELPSLPDVGTITVGGLRYTYRGAVIDLMGLNDTKMAHNGGDRIGFRAHAAFEKRTFYERKPTMVIPLVKHNADLATTSERELFVDLVLKGLLQDRRFQDAYQLAEVRKQSLTGTVAQAAWYDREFLRRLAQSGKFEIVVQGEPAPR